MIFMFICRNPESMAHFHQLPVNQMATLPDGRRPNDLNSRPNSYAGQPRGPVAIPRGPPSVSASMASSGAQHPAKPPRNGRQTSEKDEEVYHYIDDSDVR